MSPLQCFYKLNSFLHKFNIKSYTEYKQKHKTIKGHKTNQIMKYIEKKMSLMSAKLKTSFVESRPARPISDKEYFKGTSSIVHSSYTSD